MTTALLARGPSSPQQCASRRPEGRHFSRADRGTQPVGNREGVCRVCPGARPGGHGGGRRYFFGQRQRIAELALANRLATIFALREYARPAG